MSLLAQARRKNSEEWCLMSTVVIPVLSGKTIQQGMQRVSLIWNAWDQKYYRFQTIFFRFVNTWIYMTYLENGTQVKTQNLLMFYIFLVHIVRGNFIQYFLLHLKFWLQPGSRDRCGIFHLSCQHSKFFQILEHFRFHIFTIGMLNLYCNLIGSQRPVSLVVLLNWRHWTLSFRVWQGHDSMTNTNSFTM